MSTTPKKKSTSDPAFGTLRGFKWKVKAGGSFAAGHTANIVVEPSAPAVVINGLRGNDGKTRESMSIVPSWEKSRDSLGKISSP